MRTHRWILSAFALVLLPCVAGASGGAVITTVAGSGIEGYSGDGGPATLARMARPSGVAVGPDGSLYVSDGHNFRIRRVSPDGTITTVAGTGVIGFSGDGGPATAARIGAPHGIAVDASGAIYFSDFTNHRVRKVAADGTISTVAGTGAPGYTGDGIAATSARLFGPMGLALDASGNVHVADHANHRIRKISTDGTITTVAGSGGFGNAGDGGPATSATLAYPGGVAIDAAGRIVIADTENHRIRRVATDGTITTIAGTSSGFSGDGGAATSAALSFPFGVEVDAAGTVLVADAFNHRIRAIASDGTITTVAGSATAGYAGDGGSPTSAALLGPWDVAADAAGRLFVADRDNHRVRKVAPESAPAALDPPADVVQECDEGEDVATVNFVFGATVGSADLLRVRDVTNDATLLEVEDPSDGTYGVGPVAFPHGPASTVTIELLDGSAVLASASFTVQIDDTEAPELDGVADRTIELEGVLTSLTPALLGITASDACDPGPTIAFEPAALPLGTTEVTVTARDESGNTASATLDVTVEDTQAPEFLACSEDVTRDATSPDGTPVAFDVLAVDEGGDVELVCTDEDDRAVTSGSLFAVGSHTITCAAEDPSGNRSFCVFEVEIVDRADPMILCPADLTVESDPGTCGAEVTFEVVATDEADGDVQVVCEAPWGEVVSGDAFPVGATPITCRATDDAGNEATCGFVIVVQDREAPALTGPASLVLVTDCAGRSVSVDATVLGVTATDACDGAAIVTCSPTLLSPGTTTVTCTATDADGNVATHDVEVVVRKGAYAIQVLRPLDGNVDNRIRVGQTVPLKVRVTCDNAPVTGLVPVLAEVERIDGAGTPIANLPGEDDGLSEDEGSAFRETTEHYVFHLSTSGWDVPSGGRVRVTVLVQESGRVDTLASVVLQAR
jgi:hypothetical protein